MITNKELVTSVFGYWPQFADGKIVNLAYVKPDSLEIGIHYIDSDIGKEATIFIKFKSVSNIELNELRDENVIDSITISEDTEPFVTIEACYGLCGTFKCTGIDVSLVNA